MLFPVKIVIVCFDIYVRHELIFSDTHLILLIVLFGNSFTNQFDVLYVEV